MHIDELFPRQAELAHVRRVLEGTEEPRISFVGALGYMTRGEPRIDPIELIDFAYGLRSRRSFVMRNLQ